MSEQQKNVPVESAAEGLQKTEMSVITVMAMIFCLVSAGCFGMEEAIPETGPGLILVMLCVMPFVWGLPFGLVASELGSVRPQTGGYYKWVQEAFGEFWAFQSGWWRTVSIYIDNTLYVILAGGYAAQQWDLGTVPEFILKFSMIALFALLNIKGLKEVGAVSTLLSALVFIGFACVAVCGFMHWGADPSATLQMTPEPAEGIGDWFFYIAGGISVVMWQYSGYESMSTIAGEVSNPEVIPKGTLLTIPLIMATYILPTMGALGSLGHFEEWGPDGYGYSHVLTEYWGPIWGMIFVIIAILAQCSIYNTYVASGSRGFFALSDDNLAPPFLVKLNKQGVPFAAILSVSVTNVILCMLPFGLVIVLDVAMLVASYILVYLSCMKLRTTIPAEEYPFRIPGGDTFVRIMCIIPIIIAVFAYFVNGSDYYVAGMWGMLSGPVLYFIWRRKYGGLTKKDPVKYPANPKTGLQYGDTKRMALLFGLMSIMNVACCFFLPWYECWGDPVDGWASGDYFDGMFEAADVNVILNVIRGLLYALTAVTVVLTIIFAAMGKKDVDPNKKAA